METYNPSKRLATTLHRGNTKAPTWQSVREKRPLFWTTVSTTGDGRV
jgi:hypothetical protein